MVLLWRYASFAGRSSSSNGIFGLGPRPLQLSKINILFLEGIWQHSNIIILHWLFTRKQKGVRQHLQNWMISRGMGWAEAEASAEQNVSLFNRQWHSFQFPAEIKVRSSALETTGVSRGQHILQSQECVFQQVGCEIDEEPRIRIQCSTAGKHPHQIQPNSYAFV